MGHTNCRRTGNCKPELQQRAKPQVNKNKHEQLREQHHLHKHLDKHLKWIVVLVLVMQRQNREEQRQSVDKNDLKSIFFQTNVPFWTGLGMIYFRDKFFLKNKFFLTNLYIFVEVICLVSRELLSQKASVEWCSFMDLTCFLYWTFTLNFSIQHFFSRKKIGSGFEKSVSLVHYRVNIDAKRNLT